MKKLGFLVLIGFGLMVFPFSTKANHLVGGSITYECLGGGQYEVTMFVYRDCYCVECADIDDIAVLSAYTPTGGHFDTYEAGLISKTPVPMYLLNPCIENPPDVCVEVGRYNFVWNLGTIPASGLYIVYQRCCRNVTIANLTSPGDQGSTYTAFIPAPADATCNNSPVFSNNPPIAICGDDPFYFNNGAIDPDGDSLVYELCDPMTGLSTSDPLNSPGEITDPPPYMPVSWSFPYDASNPMGGATPLTINPQTGVLSGFGFSTGQYVVGVCVLEYRDGILINTLFRDFQFNVVQCNPTVVASLPSDVRNCSGYSFTFENNSVGANTYYWNFGVPELFDDTASIRNPVYEYADTGIYQIMLIVNPGQPCTDTAYTNVYVFPGFYPGFNVESDCPDAPISFDNTSFTLFGNISTCSWNFNNEFSSDDCNPTVSFTDGGIKDISLLVTSDLGCRDSIVKQLYIFENPPLDAGDDQSIYAGEPAFLSATGAINYSWFVPEGEVFSEIPNPRVYPSSTTEYIVGTISSYGCYTYDTVLVKVIPRPVLLLPSVFSPNGDQVNDFLYLNHENIKALNEFSIYNRWGQKIFTTSDINEGWDGNYKLVKQEIGAYVYYISALGMNDEPLMEKGNVSLVR